MPRSSQMTSSQMRSSEWRPALDNPVLHFFFRQKVRQLHHGREFCATLVTLHGHALQVHYADICAA